MSMGGSGAQFSLCVSIFGINSPSGDLKFKILCFPPVF